MIARIVALGVLSVLGCYLALVPLASIASRGF